MGIMQTFRRRMPGIIIFLVIMFVLLIVFEWGYDRFGRGGGFNQRSSTAVGAVNGEELSIADFDARVKDNLDMQRSQNPDAPVDEEQIREMVWQQMVNETLIRQAADRLGITVSSEQLSNAMMYDPPPALKQPFTDSTGFYNERAYHELITNPDKFLADRKYPRDEALKVKAQIKKIEQSVRLQMLADGVKAVVTAGAMPSPAEVRIAFYDERTKATGNFAIVDPNMIPDSAVKVTEADARKYYDDNKSSFVQKASREFRYVMFLQQPSAQDSSAIQRRLKQVTDALAAATTPDAKTKTFMEFVGKFGNGKYNGNAFTPMKELGPELTAALSGAKPGDVIGPIRLQDGTYLINLVDVQDSGETYVRASHILLRTNGKNDDSVKAEAEKVLARVKAGGDFAAVAQELSQDPGSAQRGGDLGFFKKGAMLKEFEEASFAASTGSIVGPVKTNVGYHIIKVTDRSSKSYKLRDLRFDPRVSNMTKTQIRAKAQTFREKLSNGGSIDTLATQMGTQVMESGPVDKNAPAAGSIRLTNFTFDGKQGDVSEIVDLKDGSLVVAQISKIRTAGTMDFADAKETIMAKLRTKKKLELIEARAKRIRAGLAAGDSLSKVTSLDSSIQVRNFNEATRTTPLAGVGFDYPLNNAMFALKEGQISDLIRGEHAYYIVQVTKKEQPTDKDFETEKGKYTQQLVQRRREQMFQEWLQKEHDRASIVDYRNQR